MKEITTLVEMEHVVNAGALGWQLSQIYPGRIFFWNTTGRENVVDFPTIYAKEELIRKAGGRIAI